MTKQVTCPKCGSKKKTRILYGLPSREGFEAADRGEVVLGGCCVSDESPVWECDDCGKQFGKDDSRNWTEPRQ